MIITDEKQLAGAIDHTILGANVTSEQVVQLCREAREYNFCSVCVLGRWVSLAASELEGSDVKVCGVVSFPHGADTTKVKVAAAHQAIFDGADEVDVVADLPAIAESNLKYLRSQLQAMARVCHSARPKVILKVIIESAWLNGEQIRFACRTADECGVDFVKTSTGLHPAGGAVVEDIKLMKESAPNCRVKAAGGIKTYAQLIEMVEAGAERIGTSSAIDIINEFRAGKR